MSWSCEERRHTSASPGALWTLLSDPDTWAKWNAGIERVDLDGDFREGASGTITPAGQVALPFRITECEPERGYTSETVIAETVTLVNRQRIEPTEKGAEVRAESSLVGEAAAYFGQSFGPQLAQRLPSMLASLCERAETLAATESPHA